MPRKTSIFVVSGTTLYVRQEAVMHYLCALIDGLPLTFFGKEKTAWLDIDTAIAWCKKESEDVPEDERAYLSQKIARMERVKAHMESGAIDPTAKSYVVPAAQPTSKAG